MKVHLTYPRSPIGSVRATCSAAPWKDPARKALVTRNPDEVNCERCLRHKTFWDYEAGWNSALAHQEKVA